MAAAIDLAVERIEADLEAAVKAQDLIVLSRLVDLVASMKDENPRAELDEEALCAKLVKKLTPAITEGVKQGEKLLKQWRSKLKVGDLVDVYSPVDGKWFASKVEGVGKDKDDGSVIALIHYQGWKVEWDRWLKVEDPTIGISPFESKVKHNQITVPHEKWTPSSMREHLEEEQRREEEKERQAEARLRVLEAQRLEEREAKREMKNAAKEYDESGQELKKKRKRGKDGEEREEDDPDADDNDWVCGMCGMLEHQDGSAMVLCDGACMRSFHLSCLGMTTPPEEDYFCQDCRDRRHTCFICKKKGADYAEVAKCREPKCGKYYHRTCLTDRSLGDWYPVEVSTVKEKVPVSGPVRAPVLPVAGQVGGSGPQKAQKPNPARASARNHRGALGDGEGEEEEAKSVELAPPLPPSSSAGASHAEMVEIQTFRFRCPQHYCSTCDHFFNTTKMDRTKKFHTELFECIACPKAYHINCIPPGTRFNSCCLLCDAHPNRILPSREPITRAFRGAAGVLEQMGIPENPPDLEDPTDHHFKLPLQLREEVSLEAAPAPFKKITNLDYDTLPGKAKGAPDHPPSGGTCQCVDRCDEYCWNRLLKIECFGKRRDGSGGDEEGGACRTNCNVGPDCGNRMFTKRQYAKQKRFREHAMGMGMKAAEDIPEGALVCEYVGEVVNEAEMIRRMEWQAHYTPNDHEFYIMELDSGIYVDGKHKGSESRHINHSCNPNLELERWVVNGKMRIGIFAIRDIAMGEPLNYDYQFDTRESASFKCFCGSENCRGTMAPSLEEADRPLTSRERKSLIRQGQLREKGLDNRRARLEAELSRCHTGRTLPGDAVQELRSGPHRATYRAGQFYKVFLPSLSEKHVRQGWGKRRGLMWTLAAEDQARWSNCKSQMDTYARTVKRHFVKKESR